MEGEVSLMEALLTSIGQFFTWIVDQAGAVLTMILENPVLILFVVGFSVVGFVLGWVARLFRTN